MAVKDAELGWLEECLCICGWVASAFYSILNVYWVSQDPPVKLAPHSFVRGWSLLGQMKDVSNYEWDFWGMWFPSIGPWLAGHVFICIVTRMLGYQYRRSVYVLYSLVALWSLLGWRLLLLALGHLLVMYAVASRGHFYMTWAMSFLLLTTLNYSPFPEWTQLMCGDDRYHHLYFLFLFSIAMTNMRYTAFCIEWCFHQKGVYGKPPVEEDIHKSQKSMSPGSDTKSPSAKETELSFSFLDMLHFCLYLPTYFYGPVMTYDKFYHQMNMPMIPWSWLHLGKVLLEFVRVSFWAVMCELVLHHVFFNAIQHNMDALAVIPLWALAGTGYCLGQYFMMKYVVFYGFPGVLSQLDQIDVPKQPKCISRIYRYSQMWKYFDRGLNSFLKRYLYIPLGGSRHGAMWQLIATAACFGFVFYWHGAEVYLFIWALNNFIAIVIETLSGRVTSNAKFIQWESQFYGPRMRRRFHGFLAVPLFAVSTLAIFTFIGGLDFGEMCLYRLFVQGFPVSVVTIWLALYCFIQTSHVIDRWEQRRQAKAKVT